MNVIDHCRDLHGRLSEANRALLADLLTSPDPGLWERARHIVVSDRPLMTLEMVMRTVRRGGADGVPDPFTVYRALRHAIGGR